MNNPATQNQTSPENRSKCEEPPARPNAESFNAGRPPDSRQGLLLIILVVAGLASAFGWPTRGGDFISGDDQRLVTDQVLVNHPSLEHAWKLMTILHGDLYQPLPMLSFQVNYAWAAPVADSRFGISARGFHLANIVLHMINSILVCLVVVRISRRRSIACLAGALFACHPFAIEPVAWVSGRMILLATCFSLLAILICLHRHGNGHGVWPVGAGITWVFSLLSKVVPTVPIAILWCDHARGQSIPRRAWIVYAIFLALSVAGIGLAFQATDRIGAGPAAEVQRSTRLPVRVLLAGGYYLENYVWPTRLAGWSPPPAGVTLQSPSAVKALLEWIALFGLLIVARRYSHGAFVGLVIFILLLAPFLAAVSARRFLAADRYMYLPIWGLHLAVASVAIQLYGWLAKRIPAFFAKGVVAAPVIGLIGLWMMIGWRLAPAWTDTIHWAQRIVDVYPNDVLSHNELARACLFQGRPDQALTVISQARRRWPDHPRLALQAGRAYRDKKDWPQAVAELRTAAAQMPGHARTQYEYAIALEHLGKIDQARRRFRDILESQPGFLPAATALAHSYQAGNETDQALAAYAIAIAINPYHRDSLFESALLRIKRQEWDKARRLLETILKLDPDDRPARFHRAVVMFRLGHRRTAVEMYDRLLVEDPTQVNVRLNRAGALAALHLAKQAEADLRAILDRKPEHLDAAIGLHELLAMQGRFDEIVAMWRTLQRRAGRRPESSAYLVWAYVLNHEMQPARLEMESIRPDSPARSFAQWSLIYEALRQKSFDKIEAHLADSSIQSRVTIKYARWSRVIVAAFSDLPKEIRDSTAGRYVLARLFLYQGDLTHARITSEKLATGAASDRWTQAAKQLLRSIPTENSNQ